MSGAKNCPETPRQKMIGMMYLVLTAMLALNVSTDILSGFKLVDNSLHSSIAASDTRNAKLYNDFIAANADNPEKTQEWFDKAKEDRFSISTELPQAEVPKLNWDSIRRLAQPAMVIAMLGAIESLLSAAVADGVIGDRHDSNQELVAQGIANMVSPLIGGIPATGAIARTMTNINNGGRTPVAGIAHAVVLALIYLFLMPLVKFIPMACLAGILVVVSYNMSEWRSFKAILKNPKSDIIVLLVTFFLTVIFDLTVAIEVGVLIACLLCMKRMAETTNVSVLSDEIDPNADSDVQGNLDHLTIPEGVKVYEINGPYFFGIGNKFEEMMGDMGGRAKVRIIRMRKVPFIDSTGVHNLSNMCRMCSQMGVKVVLSGVNPKVMKVIEDAGMDDIVGKENICSHINIALKRAEEILSE